VAGHGAAREVEPAAIFLLITGTRRTEPTVASRQLVADQTRRPAAMPNERFELPSHRGRIGSVHHRYVSTSASLSLPARTDRTPAPRCDC
jgi:hypothetical protein